MAQEIPNFTELAERRMKMLRLFGMPSPSAQEDFAVRHGDLVSHVSTDGIDMSALREAYLVHAHSVSVGAAVAHRELLVEQTGQSAISVQALHEVRTVLLGDAS